MLKLLFAFSGRVSRTQYLAVAFFCVLTKQLLDFFVATAVFKRSWGPINYVMPLGIPVPLERMAANDIIFVASMLALSLPFAWVGIALTVKRFRTIGWPLWLVVLFFVPVANIASFAVAAAWPEHEEATGVLRRGLARFVPHDQLGAAVVAILVSAIAALLAAYAGTRVIVDYGWGLFAAVPFVQGAIAVVIANVHQRRTLTQDLAVASLSVLLTAGAILVVALEGALCVAMATPLALCFAFLGATFAHAITRRRSPEMASILMLVSVVPALMGADVRLGGAAPLHEVESTIVIDSQPAAVWNHVVDFPALPPPTETLFRVGVAYPLSARIVARGVGGIRYCEFSTGDFVEPITAWQPAKRLEFNVAKNPDPMREWSPYGHIDTPHLHGYLVSRHGEFVLKPLRGGRTLLVGRTWYQQYLWPDVYWTLWSNHIIHDIHYRVLRHIKTLSENRG